MYSFCKKILAISLICGLVLSLGIFLGPEKHQAQALVFDQLISFVRSTPQYLFDEEGFSPPRKVVVNNNTTWLSVGSTTDSVTSVLNFYENYFTGQPVSMADSSLVSWIQEPELKQFFDTANEYSQSISNLRHFRVERKDYGFLGVFDLFDRGLEIGSLESMEHFFDAIETGEIGNLGIARAIIALRDQEAGKTQVINIWTDRDFNFNNLIPDKNNDVPGIDIADVPRPPGAVRLYSITQTNLGTLDSVILYEGEGSLAQTVLFYNDNMARQGWARYEDMDIFSAKLEQSDALLFMKQGRECLIHVQDASERGKVMTTIMERRGRQS